MLSEPMSVTAEGRSGWGMAAAFAGRSALEANDPQKDEYSSQELPRNPGKNDVSLGDLNPLIHFPNLGRKQSIDALERVAITKLTKSGGVLPTKIEARLVTSLKQNTNPELRFIARFETPSLTEEQLVKLEKLVNATYPVKVRTRTGSEGGDIRPNRYPPADQNDAVLSNTTGWYMGPNMTETDSLHRGLFVFRDLGAVNKDNFTDANVAGNRYLVEVREDRMYQTDLVEFIIQVGTIIGTDELHQNKDLLYEIYYDLIRLGLKGVDDSSIYGMEDAIAMIKRSLLIPLASKDLSSGIGQQPESVLMVGVPGTGKTLAIEALLQEETGVFILPIDPLELMKELQSPKEKQTLLPRIAQVSRKTGKRVVLHIDDIENMIKNDGATHSTLLNLMQGIQDNDFYIIASTNDPEKIDKALLEPQRFGILIYCGLPVEEARREILSIHTNALSERIGHQLFPHPRMREVILDAVTRKTVNFTPRYIAEIANIAKANLLYRIAQGEGRSVDLTEDALTEYQFIPDDWTRAFAEVASRYNKAAMVNRDEQLQEFVKKHTAVNMGFSTSNYEGPGQVLFTPEERQILTNLDPNITN